MSVATASAIDDLTAVLKQICGPEHVISDPNECAVFSQDIWQKGETADLIVAPADSEETAKLVEAASTRGVAVYPRGGGMSYTNGYTPATPGGVIIDFTRMNRVVEINAEDMYVTVEAGCTWQDLHIALKPLGLRTPFWGPLSGISSTIGGGLSQNNAFFGAGTYGPTSDSVTSLKVVLADGSIVETGTASTRGAKPFWRHYGPDLTGVFMGDAGALGFKVEATFRLIQAPSHEDWASFEFATLDGVAKAAADMARTGIACELFGFDPNLTKVRLKRASLAADVKTLKNVVAGQGSLLKGVKEGAKIALAGRSFMADAAYSLHAIVEGRSKAGVADGMAELKSIAEKHGAREIENSIPKIIRANPFTPLNNMLGPEGERWAPVHGIISMSDGPACWARIDALFETLRDELDAHNILTGYLVTTLSTNGYLIEPVFIWPEELFDIHERSVEKDFLARLPRHKSNPDATALVAKVRSAVVDVFAEFGGAHFQIGKTYPYRESRTAAAWALVEALKSHVDAKRVINPGALGLK